MKRGPPTAGVQGDWPLPWTFMTGMMEDITPWCGPVTMSRRTTTGGPPKDDENPEKGAEPGCGCGGCEGGRSSTE